MNGFDVISVDLAPLIRLHVESLKRYIIFFVKNYDMYDVTCHIYILGPTKLLRYKLLWFVAITK